MLKYLLRFWKKNFIGPVWGKLSLKTKRNQKLFKVGQHFFFKSIRNNRISPKSGPIKKFFLQNLNISAKLTIVIEIVQNSKSEQEIFLFLCTFKPLKNIISQKVFGWLYTKFRELLV
jgi:hypothetical protein